MLIVTLHICKSAICPFFFSHLLLVFTIFINFSSYTLYLNNVFINVETKILHIQNKKVQTNY